MNLIVKTFQELNTKELYEILKARSQIFGVEQQTVYQDLDDIDYNAMHFFFMENDKVIAYLRAFYKDDNHDIVQVGRVLTVVHGKGFGRKLYEKSIPVILEKMPTKKLFMNAQKQAAGFYEKLGFKIISEEFIEKGVPHVFMELEIEENE